MLRVSLLIVHSDVAKESPKVFQDYVSRYFSQSDILGQPSFFALQTLHGDQGSRGVAPYATHARYVGSRARLQELDTWIKKAIDEGLIWRFSVGLQDGGGSRSSD